MGLTISRVKKLAGVKAQAVWIGAWSNQVHSPFLAAGRGERTISERLAALNGWDQASARHRGFAAPGSPNDRQKLQPGCVPIFMRLRKCAGQPPDQAGGQQLPPKEQIGIALVEKLETFEWRFSRFRGRINRDRWC